MCLHVAASINAMKSIGLETITALSKLAEMHHRQVFVSGFCNNAIDCVSVYAGKFLQLFCLVWAVPLSSVRSH
jgi:small basic protein